MLIRVHCPNVDLDQPFMPDAEWLGLPCKHLPDRYEHLVRYVASVARY